MTGRVEAMPESPEPAYNSGNALYRQELYDEARSRYDNSLETARPELSQNVAFNTGNSLFQFEAFEDAVEAYKQALRLDPNDEDAKHNLELALKRIEEREQEDQEDQETTGGRSVGGTAGREWGRVPTRRPRAGSGKPATGSAAVTGPGAAGLSGGRAGRRIRAGGGGVQFK